MHFKVSAVLPVDARTFLVERDSAAFRALVAKTQKLGALEIEHGWRDGNVQVFKLVTKPDIDRFVPKRLQHYIPGGELTYTDIIRYDPELLENPPFKLIVHSIPPIFKTKTTIDCELTIEEVEGGKCRQTLEGDVTIGIPGLGRIAERIIGSSLRDVYSGIPEIVERWNLFRDEVLQRPDGREVLFNGRPPLQEDWVSKQVADVLRQPYGAAANVPAGLQLAKRTQFVDTAVAATAKPGLESAAAPDATAPGAAAPSGPAFDGVTTAVSAAPSGPAFGGVAAAVSAAPSGPAFGGAAEDAQGSAAEQSRAGFLAAGSHTTTQQPPVQKPSPFAGVPGRLSTDNSPRVEDVDDRGRSVAQFEGELFYEPDDIPDSMDPAAAAELRQDHAEAMDWYREHSVRGQPAPATSAMDEEPSDDGSTAEAAGNRMWWRRQMHAKLQGSTSDSGVRAPLAANASNYLHWANFWEKQSVAPQETAPRAATRLGYLFGTAVKLGLVKPTHAHGNEKGPQGGEAAGSPVRVPVSRKKSVGFASPIVNGVREATPGASDDEEEEDTTKEMFCSCFPMPRSHH